MALCAITDNAEAAVTRDRGAPLTLRLFGAFEARRGEAPLPRLRTRKGQWLLALLALRPGSELQRDWLAGTLWPDSPDPTALANLRSVLQDFRRALGPDAHRPRCPTTRPRSLVERRASPRPGCRLGPAGVE